MIKSRLISCLAFALLVACSKKEALPDDPEWQLQKIIDQAKPPSRGKILSLRTEPTQFPSHSAIIESDNHGDVFRFSVFRKDGEWYYKGPVSMVSQGTTIKPQYLSENGFSIEAYQYALKR